MKIKPKTYYKKFALFPVKCRCCKSYVVLEKYVAKKLVWYSEYFNYCMDCAKKFEDY